MIDTISNTILTIAVIALICVIAAKGLEVASNAYDDQYVSELEAIDTVGKQD